MSSPVSAWGGELPRLAVATARAQGGLSRQLHPPQGVRRHDGEDDGEHEGLQEEEGEHARAAHLLAAALGLLNFIIFHSPHPLGRRQSGHPGLLVRVLKPRALAQPAAAVQPQSKWCSGAAQPRHSWHASQRARVLRPNTAPLQNSRCIPIS